MPAQTPLELGLECLKANRIDEAIQYLEEATTRFPEDYRGFNYLGVAYARKELYNRAVGAFLAALHIRSNIPSIHYNLGLAYRADGFPDRAREEFQEALRLDPSYQKAEQALKALEVEEQSSDAVSAQACTKHTDEPAVALCSFCHLPVCGECKTIVDGSVYCPRCAEQQAKG